MENKSLRYNEEKPKWSLVHYKSLEPMVRVLEMGAKKYSPDNWKIGLDRSEILESMMRHLTALMDGELLDKESGISHMAHIQCNAMFYNYHEANNSFTKEGVVSTVTEDESTWSERKKATFKFFNEFPEPYRSQAKDNYDEDFDLDVPSSKREALRWGFRWTESPEGEECWAKFCSTL